MTIVSRAANKSSGRSNSYSRSSRETNRTRGLGKLSTSMPRNPARARSEAKNRAKNNP